MAAFDVITKPTSLSLKPGSTGSIMVVVSNRLGKPVMGLVEGVLTPATVAKWLESPPPDQAQRRYEADPAATANLEFKVVVPNDASAQDVQFMASARDVLSPDDTRVDGQTVAIKVTPEPIVVDGGGTKIPWWVWVIVALVVVGAGVGIWLAVRQKGVPDVVGKTPEKAIEALKSAGFDSVTSRDSLDETASDTTVVAQDPAAGTDLPPKSDTAQTVATITMTVPATKVPAIKQTPLSIGVERIRDAGLRVGKYNPSCTNQADLDERIHSAVPDVGQPIARGGSVDLGVYSYTTGLCLRDVITGDWNRRYGRSLNMGADSQ